MSKSSQDNYWQKYYQSRFRPEAGRDKVWKAIAEYVQIYIDRDNDIVLDLGAGYCNFINNIIARKRIASDINPDVKVYLNEGIEFILGTTRNLSKLKSNSIGVVFSSNLFEHFDDHQMDVTLKQIWRILKKNGLLIIIQPNYKYAYREYFDDYTHKKVYSHISLSSLLETYGFSRYRVFPRFLPLTMDSILPKSYILTKIYLCSPFKPLAKQMLLICKKS